MLTTIETAARRWAEAKHGNQKYGSRPYVYHLDMVWRICRDYELPSNVRVAAFLHDVLEDTPAEYKQIVNVFGENIADIVDAVTDRVGKNRRERHEKTYPRMRAIGGKHAVSLKVADRLGNAIASYDENKPDLFHMYQREYAYFRHTLYSPEDDLDHLWDDLQFQLSKHL